MSTICIVLLYDVERYWPICDTSLRVVSLQVPFWFIQSFFLLNFLFLTSHVCA